MRKLLLLLALVMPVNADNAGLILGPYFEIAELIASTEEWQNLTNTMTVAGALDFIAFPEYVDFETANAGKIALPASVISNPWDLGTELFGPQDRQGRVDRGQLLWQLFLQTDADDAALLNFIHSEELILAQMAALSGKAKDSGSGWHISVDSFQLAFAAGRVPLSNLQGMVGADDTPQSVTTGAWVLDWKRS